MTKEELRERILELEDRMSKEDSRKAVSEMNDEWEELSNNLENILYEELEGMALKVITEKIIERYDIDTDILMSEYMDNGDLEKAFTVAAEECDCGWKEDIKKEIIKRYAGSEKLLPFISEVNYNLAIKQKNVYQKAELQATENYRIVLDKYNNRKVLNWDT